jgi:DNA-binding NarL/FixJ family response regulator
VSWRSCGPNDRANCVRSVKSHIGRIFVKLGLRDRAAAIVYAYDNGIVAPR